MNTAISVTGTGEWEGATTRTTPVPIPPGETGTGRPGGGGSPVRGTRPERTSHPCATLVRPAGTRGGRPPAAPHTTPARRGPAVPQPVSDDLVHVARAGYAATAATAVLTAAVVVGLLALAHLRAPEPAPTPVPSGIPAVAVPGEPHGAPPAR
ncbi:hypothetical protein [Nocardia sp. NPDC019395]|uniref:hypothetical protein n=1 Tax=Nocardia sp. NPDC019395 TaxID=3154686 RepID=UPI0033E40191